MNVLALCAGIGGLDLGLRIANPSARCVCYVEGEGYAASILVKRMEEKILDEAAIWSDVRTFDGRPWCGVVDCITGGYPCQPFSSIGKKLGKEDPRWLWASIARIIGEIKPEWCFFENVSAHLRVGFEQVHDELCSMGYRVTAGLFTAAEVGAGHKRERLFLLAHSISERRRGEIEGTCAKLDYSSGEIKSEESQIGGFAHAIDDGCSIMGNGDEVSSIGNEMDMGFPPCPDSEAWRDLQRSEFYPATVVESTILGKTDGLAARMDSLRCSGNAVCPLVAAYAFNILKNALETNT